MITPSPTRNQSSITHNRKTQSLLSDTGFARFSLPVYFPFTLPVCDQLVGEIIGFTPEKTKSLHLVEPVAASIPLLPATAPLPPRELVNPARRISRVAAYIYQKVVRRTPFGVQPSPKNPQYLLFGAKELLECGHEKTIYATPTETFTARVRNCWECSGWFGGLKLDDIKKPVQRAARAAKNKMAGQGGWRAILCATVSAIFVIATYYIFKPQVNIYAAPESYVRVIQKYDDNAFLLQVVTNGDAARPSVWHFCPAKDWKPLIQVGFTLTQLKWIERKDCSEISPAYIHHAYIILRDDAGRPVMPPNCINPDHAEASCNGEPEFPDF